MFEQNLGRSLGYDGDMQGVGVLYPSLAESLERLREGDDSYLKERAWMLGPRQVSALAIASIDRCLRFNRSRYLLIEHEPVEDMPRKGEILGEHIAEIADYLGTQGSLHFVRTLTMSLRTVEPMAPVMVTNLGPVIGKDAKKGIAASLQLPNSATKEATINPHPSKWDPCEELGLAPGLLCPFIEPDRTDRVKAWYYLDEDGSADTPVEIALSPSDSLIIRRDALEQLMRSYDRYLHGRSFVATLYLRSDGENPQIH